MFKPEAKIIDPLSDQIGKLIEKIRAIPNWTKEKNGLRQSLISLLEKNRYISFCGHVDKYHISCVGESCLYDVPTNRRGHLKVFRGKRIRLVCIWSGRYDRLYMAGKYFEMKL
jgi:hypothetical protein